MRSGWAKWAEWAGWAGWALWRNGIMGGMSIVGKMGVAGIPISRMGLLYVSPSSRRGCDLGMMVGDM